MQRQMKYEEQIAMNFLESQGFPNIIYEPKGNRTPDFLLNNEIAVEVRRLNQYSTNESKPRPLEELYYDLIPNLQKLFNTYDTGNYTTSAFVSVYFRRPLKVDKTLITKIIEILNQHAMVMELAVEYKVSENLILKIVPSDQRLEHQFNFGTLSDNDSGGFTLSNIPDSLILIIKEKENKITPFYGEFKSWWLVLIDFIGYGFDSNELTALKRITGISKFERIYFISPVDPTKGDYI
jgi:hypothetical protein